MKLLSLEPTPNPNSMKLNLDNSLSEGESYSYTEENKNDCPDFITKLIEIPGVESVYHMADFVAIQRNPRVEWKSILSQAKGAFDGISSELNLKIAEALEPQSSVGQGGVQVEIQMYRNIPMQVKATSGIDVARVALPEQFKVIVEKANKASPNFLKERKWVDHGIRYGAPNEVAEEVMEEISAVYDPDRLEKLLKIAIQMEEQAETVISEEKVDVTEFPNDPDWRKRYAALEKMEPKPEAVPMFVKALGDPKPSIRRLAAAMLGLSNGPKTLAPLCEALKDESVSVRRTAGDSLSDLGDPEAIAPMIEALKDNNKLVRWRAARFLYETGDESALPALKEVEGDPEFEVKMQIRMAIERIEGGHSAQGPVWQQMTRQ